MEEVTVSGKSSSDAGSGCNYQASPAENVDTAVSSADLHHQSSSGMLLQHQHLHHPHQFQSEQARVLPPQYDSVTSLNNNNSYSALDSDNSDRKYPHLRDHLLGSGQPYHHHDRYHQLDNYHHNHHHHQHQQHHQPLAHCQLDYCNALPGQPYGMTSSSSGTTISCSGVAVSRPAAGYCGRGQLDLVAAAAAASAYSPDEHRTAAGYWTTSCGVDATDPQQQQQPAADIVDDQVDVKPTLLDPSSYIYPPVRQYAGYLPGWYQAAGYTGWGLPGSGIGDPTGPGYYYQASAAAYNGTAAHSSSPPMHHILRGVYNTLQVSC